jgi:hypothetical protein
MLDINRFVILILIMILLYALYMYQQKMPSLPFFTQNNDVVKKRKKEKIYTKARAKVTTNTKKKKKKETKHVKWLKKENKDKTDLITIDNISQVSLGSLLDVDSDAPHKNSVYKQAKELESNGTFGSLLNDSSDKSQEEDFFFQ